MQDLKIDKANMYEEENVNQDVRTNVPTSITKSQSSLENGFRLKQEGVIEGKGSQARGPPNVEQTTLVRKKKSKKNGYGIILFFNLYF